MALLIKNTKSLLFAFIAIYSNRVLAGRFRPANNLLNQYEVI